MKKKNLLNKWKNSGLVLAMLMGIALFLGNSVKTQNPIKNVVLVHGAFADGSGWKALYEVLTKKGYHVTIVQNPLTSLEDDVAATKLILDNQDGPVILVGCSDHRGGQSS